MHEHPFDRFSRLLAGPRQNRRSILAGVATVAGALRIDASLAQEGTPTPADHPEFLFVQTASSGAFEPNPDAGTPVTANGTPVAATRGAYLLTLAGHGGGTVYFSDRPDRIVGQAPTQQFLDGLNFTPVNPPNAALVASVGGEQAIIVLELTNPAYDQDADVLTYEASLLEAYEGTGLAHLTSQEVLSAPPDTFGESSLFIDDCPDVDIACYTATGSEQQCVYEGNINGEGTCWHWYLFECDVCRGDPDDLCNAQFPGCGGNCIGLTSTQGGTCF